MDVRIITNDDESVTLEVGSIRAHISGDTWKEANDAAHMLGQFVAGRADAREVCRRIRLISSQLLEVERSIDAVDFHVQGALDLVR